MDTLQQKLDRAWLAHEQAVINIETILQDGFLTPEQRLVRLQQVQDVIRTRSREVVNAAVAQALYQDAKKT